jgi:phosphatidylserine/phosphatidylglycerophosphate/cardiolipin synthase-like enzyme
VAWVPHTSGRAGPGCAWMGGASTGGRPHQKLIVVDGLVAFKGSTNLTLNGRRKPTRGLDHVEFVTNINEVIDLHNRLFSPVWASFSKIGNLNSCPLTPCRLGLS